MHPAGAPVHHFKLALFTTQQQTPTSIHDTTCTLLAVHLSHYLQHAVYIKVPLLF